MSTLYMGYIVPGAILLPLWVGGMHREKRPVAGYSILLCYLLIMAVISVVSKILLLNKITNIPLIHTDTVIEVVLLLLYLGKVLKTEMILKALRLLVVLFPLYCLINFLFLQSIYSFNTYTRPVGAILLIALCMGYWWEYGKIDEAGKWSANPHNWFISGILLYFSSALLLFVFSNYLAAGLNKQGNLFVWNIHATLVLIMYLLFTVGFLNARQSHR